MIFLLSLTGCVKEDGVCVSTSGKLIREQRYLSDFDSIRVTDYVNVIITQDSVNTAMVEAGEYVAGGIITKVSGRELHIGNTNQCNWLRSYSKPLNVHLHVKNLMKIHYESSGDIHSTDTIRTGYLKIDMWGGCGTIDLLVNVGDGHFIQHMGTSTLILKGVCNVSSVYSGDYGLLKLDGLRTGFTFVKCSGSNDCYVNARHELNATITSIGNIYYTGNPSEIKFSGTGEGKLIPL